MDQRYTTEDKVSSHDQQMMTAVPCAKLEDAGKMVRLARFRSPAHLQQLSLAIENRRSEARIRQTSATFLVKKVGVKLTL